MKLTQNACHDSRQQLVKNLGAKITVNLEAIKVIAPNGKEYRFEMHPLKRRCLLEGLDDISLTRKYSEEIQRFEANHHRSKPFLEIQISN